ncbi:PilZ domain-containing protein [Paraglaciecola aquimarina]|uniref:PilZ domain-containing protein n=1 Tax=Paraglaciecola aquimarina TaxID=1235557 RepID=A0ABU3SY00_9ALTE|nr:PilZ domain-containing protein [Paraglaciecola aquimarina]MDU0354857.1 PilZ domain-containing protein [Paraglaciecola aquimarina]
MDLQITTLTGVKRVRTEFVGMDNKRCLIIKFPDESKWGRLKDAIFKDNTMVVRYILEDDIGEIIAFKVKVLLVTTAPTDLIFTSFPTAIQSHDLRAEPRAQTSIAVKLTDAQTNEPLCHCVIIDISSNGCRVSIDKKVLVGTPAMRQVIKMHLSAASDKSIELEGTIMSTKVDEVFRYFGIKFDTPKSEVKQLLKDMMVVTA